MSPDLKKSFALAIIIALALPLPLLGEELKLIPGLSLKEEFNDNIFLATGSPRKDFITTLTPSLDLSSTTERLSGSLSTGVNLLDYSRNSALNSADYFVQSGVTYRYDPRISISAGAGYLRNSRPDRSDDNGLALKTGSDRQNYQLSANYAVSEKSSSTFSYAYSQELFDNPSYLTTEVHTATIALDYDLDRILRQAKLTGSFGFARNLTDVSQVDNYTATVGLSKKFHELWGFSLNAGGRYTLSEFDMTTVIAPSQAVTSKTTSDEDGFIGNFAINYNDESRSGALTFNHDITAASGRSGATERTGFSANLTERFTSELSGIVGMGYYWNRSDQNQYSSQSIDEKNLIINCGLRYDFSEHLYLEGQYRYNSIDYSRISSQAAQNVFMLRLTMRRDLLDL